MYALVRGSLFEYQVLIQGNLIRIAVDPLVQIRIKPYQLKTTAFIELAGSHIVILCLMHYPRQIAVLSPVLRLRNQFLTNPHFLNLTSTAISSI